MCIAIVQGAWVAIGVGAVLLLWAIVTFNSFVRLKNRVKEAFSGIDVQLKRRHELVPNLVKVVKAYASHEKETLEEVIAARSQAKGASSLPERQARENGLSRSLDKLIALVEQYPDLKADKNFRELHHDLVDLENDLQYARRYYNGTVRDFNTRTQQFPANVLAGVFAEKERAFFEIEDAAERDAPAVVLDADA